MNERKIGILGSGEVARSLSAGFVKYGFEVMVGSRSPEKLESWKKEPGLNIQIGTFADAASFGEILVLAVKGKGALEALKLAGKENLSGKTIIDTTNPIEDAPPENGVIKFFTSLNKSLMEKLQAAYPDAHFVKAFNCIGNALMVNPDFGGEKPTMFICGNNTDAKTRVEEIVLRFGFEIADMGGAESARAIEPLCILWLIPGMLRNEWTHGFKLLKHTQVNYSQ